MAPTFLTHIISAIDGVNSNLIVYSILLIWYHSWFQSAKLSEIIICNNIDVKLKASVMNWNKFLQIELNWDTWACWFAQSSKTDFDPPMKKLHNRTDAKCIHVKKRLKDVFFPEKHFSCFDLDIMISMCILSLEKRETNKHDFFVCFVQFRVAPDFDLKHPTILWCPKHILSWKFVWIY